MKRFRNILFVVEDASTDDAAALARSVSLAENNQARLTLLYVAEPPRLGPFADALKPAEVESRARERALESMDSLFAPHRGRVQATMEVRFGKVFIEVVREVLRNHRDLVMKTAGDGGLQHILFGGADRHLLRKCPCPVWIMRPDESPNYRRIIAAVDFDPWGEVPDDGHLNRLILELAGSLAVSDFAELHLVHAWEPMTDSVIRVFGSDLSAEQIAANANREQRGHQAHLESLSDSLRNWIGAEAHNYLLPELHLRQGAARKVIPELVSELEADLVVMGTISRTGISGLIIGNTAELILSSIGCSVLAVKPEGFVSPVKVDD